MFQIAWRRIKLQLNDISKRLPGELGYAESTHMEYTCMLGRGTGSSVASFHTIEALLIFCFIVSLELKLFFSW